MSKFEVSLSEETGLRQLQEDNLKHHKNPLINYLKINSLRNKITEIKFIMKALSLDYLILSETKIAESFQTANLMLKAMKSELGVIEINTTGV